MLCVVFCLKTKLFYPSKEGYLAYVLLLALCVMYNFFKFPLVIFVKVLLLVTFQLSSLQFHWKKYAIFIWKNVKIFDQILNIGDKMSKTTWQEKKLQLWLISKWSAFSSSVIGSSLGSSVKESYQGSSILRVQHKFLSKTLSLHSELTRDS